nr:uncharacterized protein LOC117833468 isoform X2 [Setaria viridis]
MPYPFCPVIPPSGFPIPVRKGDPSVRRREPALPPVHSLRRHRLGSTRRIRRSASSVHCSGGGDGVLKMTPSECPPWKRTKKTIVKAGRKNAKEDFASEVVLTTPRKRATAAREATIAATKKAEAEPNEAEASTSMQYTKRRLDLEAPLALEIH